MPAPMAASLLDDQWKNETEREILNHGRGQPGMSEGGGLFTLIALKTC